MNAKEFYSKRAIKHQLRRAIKRDSKYLEDAIIQIMEDYKDDALKNMESLQDIVSDEVKEPKLNQVWKNERTGNKFVLKSGNIDVVKSDLQSDIHHYTFVCERPHEDGSFAYSCSWEWCRCRQ